MGNKDQSREKNPNWRGGRVVDPRGYVLIRVGKEHPLADVRGYAYEHRLNAEKAMDRPLGSGEDVHHRDEVKSNNDPENLKVCTIQEHHVEHRRVVREHPLRMPGEENPQIACACGCEGMLLKFDKSGRPRRFLPAHNNRLRERGPNGRMA